MQNSEQNFNLISITSQCLQDFREPLLDCFGKIVGKQCAALDRNQPTRSPVGNCLDPGHVLFVDAQAVILNSPCEACFHQGPTSCGHVEDALDSKFIQQSQPQSNGLLSCQNNGCGFLGTRLVLGPQNLGSFSSLQSWSGEVPLQGGRPRSWRLAESW